MTNAVLPELEVRRRQSGPGSVQFVAEAVLLAALPPDAKQVDAMQERFEQVQRLNCRRLPSL